MVNGSVVKPTEVMSERDTMEAFLDGADKSIGAARELLKETGNPDWESVIANLQAMRDGGKKLADMKAMSRFETLMAAELKANPKGLLN